MNFRDRLSEVLEQRGIVASTWPSDGRISKNLVELSTSPERIVLYVKEFNTKDKKGFWGITKNQMGRLKEAEMKWFAVLLLRSATVGYLLTSDEVQHHINDDSFELSGDGDYKINEYLDLKHTQKFESLQELLTRIL